MIKIEKFIIVSVVKYKLRSLCQKNMLFDALEYGRNEPEKIFLNEPEV